MSSSTTSAEGLRDVTRDRIQQIEAYLKNALDGRETPLYVKSWEVADELDHTTKEIGGAWPEMKERENGLTIEKWGQSTTYTWQVTESEGTE